MWLNEAHRGMVVRFSAGIGHEAGEGTIERVYGASVMVVSDQGRIEFPARPAPDSRPGAFLGRSLRLPLRLA